MWQKLVNWYQAHTGMTHALAGFVAFMYAAYEKYPPFHDEVLKAYGAMPSGVQHWIALGIGFYMWYRNGQKQG